MATPTTPCPACGAALRVVGERATCPACGQRVRFVDAPEHPCPECGAAVPVPPGASAARCRCGGWVADRPGRPIVAKATCPRCRRRIQVPLQGASAVCPHCRSALAVSDTA